MCWGPILSELFFFNSCPASLTVGFTPWTSPESCPNTRAHCWANADCQCAKAIAVYGMEWSSLCGTVLYSPLAWRSHKASALKRMLQISRKAYRLYRHQSPLGCPGFVGCIGNSNLTRPGLVRVPTRRMAALLEWFEAFVCSNMWNYFV